MRKVNEAQVQGSRKEAEDCFSVRFINFADFFSGIGGVGGENGSA